MNTILKVKTEWLCGYVMVISVSLFYPGDFMADWELWLLSCLASQETLSYQIWLVQENIKIKNSKYNFYWIWIIFTSSYSWKINLNLFSLGTICILLHIWKRIPRSSFQDLCLQSRCKWGIWFFSFTSFQF